MTSVVASLAGTVYKVLIAPGDEVKAGQEVVILESMKMEIPVETEFAGKVIEVLVHDGDFVNENDPLLILE
jgi:acetyl-CoA carboxylase biotin carboxyl carrier protein